MDYAFIKVGCHGAGLLKLLKQVCSCSVHDGRRRPPHDTHTPSTPTVAAAAGYKETPLLAADVPMCADVVFVVTVMTGSRAIDGLPFPRDPPVRWTALCLRCSVFVVTHSCLPLARALSTNDGCKPPITLMLPRRAPTQEDKPMAVTSDRDKQFTPPTGPM